MMLSYRGGLLVLVAVMIATSACGGDDSGDPSPARPGSRLTWNQQAASVTQLRALSFQLYVDGTPLSMSDVRCNETAGSAGYECSGGLPSMSAGRHTLHLVSIMGGVESERSAPLTITFGAASLTSTIGVPAPIETAETSANGDTPMCVSTFSSQACDTLRRVSTALLGASSLTAIPDGRLLFVERDSLVRVVANGLLLPNAALILDDPSSKIVGLAVDSNFERSRAVFVAWTSASRDGVELNVTRYRELQDTLAEGATIAAGLAFEDGLRAPLVVDGDGLLYVAMPRTERAPSAILRLTRDGYVPQSNRALSPAIGDGFARPADLAIDLTTKRVWMSGADPERNYSVAAFASIDDLVRQGTPEPLLARNDIDDAPALAVLRRSAEDATASLLVARGGELFRGDIGTGAQQLRRLSIAPDVPIVSIAEGPAGSWYVLTGAKDGAQSLFQLLPR